MTGDVQRAHAGLEKKATASREQQRVPSHRALLAAYAERGGHAMPA